MKKIDISTKAIIYNDVSELSGTDKTLMERAILETQNSYAPYSLFRVAAAFLLEDDTVFVGTNQENAAYPSGMCAERVGIWAIGAHHPNKKIKKLAIAVKSENGTVDTPVGPCGACRQSMFEYEFKQEEAIEILFMGEVGKIVKVPSVKSLLPFSFDGTFL